MVVRFDKIPEYGILEDNMEPIIKAGNLSKQYKIYKRGQGLTGAIRTLFSTQHTIINAVDSISFEIGRGEIVGFIGPNGAGKSTTIKMLAGILHPSSGELRVAGNAPCKKRRLNARKIGVVFGQRSQLLWDLPLLESFNLLRHIYSIPKQLYEIRLAEYMELMDMRSFIANPVRSLSLGQKARGEIVAAMLHEPEILFLDEPTIGLDVNIRDRILDYVKHINKTRNVTVLFTSHDLNTIESICDRFIIIDKGKIVFDGNHPQLCNIFGPLRYAAIHFEKPVADIAFDPGLNILKKEGHVIYLVFNQSEKKIQDILDGLSACGEIMDVTISGPTIESVVKRLIDKV